MINYTEKHEHNAKFAVTKNANVDAADQYSLLMTGEGFVCFKPFLDEMKENRKGRDAYEICVAFPEKCAALRDIMEKVKEFKNSEFQKKRGANLPFKKGSDYIDNKIEKLELEGADADEIAQVEQNYGAMRGHIFFSAKTYFSLSHEMDKKTQQPMDKPLVKPQLIDWNLRPCNGDAVNGKSIVRVQVHPYAYTNPENFGVALGLRSVQLLAKGEEYGGGSNDSAGAFESTGNEKEDEEDASASFAGDPVKTEGKPKEKPKEAEKAGEVEFDEEEMFSETD